MNKTSLTKVARVALSGLAMAAMAVQAWANELNDIKFSELPGNRMEMRLSFSELPPEPAGYTIEQPARIVMDFAGVESALEAKKYPLNIGAARSAVIISSEDRTRLIINLDELPLYSTRREGNDVIIQVGADQAVAGTVAAPASTASSGGQQRFKAASGVGVSNVDFRRGEGGEGKVIVTLTDPAVNIDVERNKGRIQLTFLGATLPDSLRQRLDVTDFATPVENIVVDYDGRNTVITVDPTDTEYDYLAYQTDNEYVLSVKPLTRSELAAQKKEFQFSGEKLSLNFQDIEVRSVLQLIADFTDLNLVASDTVEGRITLRLDGVPWDQALDLILKAKGLDKRQEGSVIMVAPAAEIAERERQELETRKALQSLAPLRTEFIQVRYADAKELFKLFQGERGDDAAQRGGFGQGRQDENSTRSILSERGSAIVDERTNSIILTDTEEKIIQFRELIAAVDIPIRQVMIEARIVIANSDFMKELGVRWNTAYHSHDRNNPIVVDPTTGQTFQRHVDSVDQEVTGNLGGSFFLEDNQTEEDVIVGFDSNGEPIEVEDKFWTPSLADTLLVDLGVANPAGQIAYTIFKDGLELGLELSALEDVGKAEIVSQPKVVTGDKQQASIESGTEVPYLEATSSGAASIAFREAVLKLDVIPQITPDDNIIMDLQINQDSVGDVGVTGVPTIDVTQLQTKVLVANGETVVLGGIFQNQKVEGETKIPLLGDIPYLGNLFKKTIRQDDKRELLIFITPRIVEDEVFGGGFSK
ncbi:type IV pilus secretin PilQ family protein [Biformimicrobium ophioploci]|uniref:Type IV pilus secretin PilQ family protein n=1 Tax=Biformimicrobium ophioploci TaxID=3036711 RepID=A0ABQ6LUX3_9GAMM|nr:type IV pilus secretin PilQ family protein [Microbulbifer sp. NKW57]GMG85899.1 type IV pilus secretin PilQ family protein [Microbulbifer sp. NKW57]